MYISLISQGRLPTKLRATEILKKSWYNLSIKHLRVYKYLYYIFSPLLQGQLMSFQERGKDETDKSTDYLYRIEP